MLNQVKFFVFIFLISFSSGQCEGPEFDFLMLSQSWSVTECMDWEGRDPANYCAYSGNPNAFYVHGLWPSKNGTSDGPFYCSSKPKYDPSDIDPIRDEMNTYWVNIRGGTDSDSFWKHEWQKHGTCAQELPEFNSVCNYFNNTLNLKFKYDLFEAFSESGILPDGLYAVDDLVNAIVEKFGGKPQIHCILDTDGIALLDEVRLCLSNSLELIDCDSVGDKIHNCYGQDTLKYLNTTTTF